MHHCGNALYLQDKFCTQCGEGINENRKLKTLTDIESSLFADLAESCPEAKVFTGRLKSSFHYTRRSNKNNVTYSYWWLTLESVEGEIKQISIDAENSAFNSLKVGDVISLLEPSEIHLNFELNAAAKGTVTNNLLASGVILHKDDGQVSTLTNHYDCSKPSISAFFFIGIVLAFIITMLISINDRNASDGIIIIGIVISIVCMIPLYNSCVTQFNKNNARKESIDVAIAKILSISKYQLGFHRVERMNLDNDIFCDGCKSRIQTDLTYCPHCGNNQLALQKQLLESETENNSVVAMDAESDIQLQLSDTLPDVELPARKNIREMRLEKMTEFYLSYKQKFVYRHVLSPNENFNGSAWCYMVQVIDRNLNTSVEDVTYVTTYRTNSEYKTSTDRVRTSDLYGYIIVEDELGETFKQWLPQSLMSHTDVGDYLFIGYSKIKKDDKRHSYGEYYYNISKGRWNKPESVHKYGEVSLLSKIVMCLACIGSGVLAYYSQSLVVAGSVLGVFMLGVLIKTHNSEKANKNDADELIQPIMDMLYKVEENKQELLVYLDKLK